MQKNITGKARRQYQSITQPPISDAHVSDLLREMARLDNFNAENLMSSDTAPCESEYPDEIEVTYEREPIAKGVVHSAGIVVVCIVLGFILAVIKVLF